MIYFKFLVYFDLSFKKEHITAETITWWFTSYFSYFAFRLLWHISQRERITVRVIEFISSSTLIYFPKKKRITVEGHYFRNRIKVAFMTKVISWWFYFKFLLFCFALLWQRNTLRSKSLMIYFFNLLWSISQKKCTTAEHQIAHIRFNSWAIIFAILSISFLTLYYGDDR